MLKGVGSVKDAEQHYRIREPYTGILQGIRSIHRGANSMRNARRLTMMGLLLCGVLALAPNSWAQQRAPILDQVAKTYGIDSWDQVEAIRYTWNGEITGLFKAAHKWEWEPKTNKVSFEGLGKDAKPVKVSYVRTDLGSQTDAVKNEVDPSFINDNYWVLFPFHAYWDKSATVIDQGKFNLPLGPGIAELVPVPRLLVEGRPGDRSGQVYPATRPRHGRAGPREVSRRWRLHARRHLGS